MPSAERFDAVYYDRFYGTRPVHDRRRIGQLATAVTSMAAWWRMPVRSVLDVGAGKGYWRDWCDGQEPPVEYRGIDGSAHACAEYGHELADLATWDADGRYDLVVCQSVLQYVTDDVAERAITVMADACRALLMIEVPTLADRDSVIDPDTSDLDIEWRPGGWYRHRLDEHFTEIGAGLWTVRTAGLPLFEMERSR